MQQPAEKPLKVYRQTVSTFGSDACMGFSPKWLLFVTPLQPSPPIPLLSLASIVGRNMNARFFVVSPYSLLTKVVNTHPVSYIVKSLPLQSHFLSYIFLISLSTVYLILLKVFLPLK